MVSLTDALRRGLLAGAAAGVAFGLFLAVVATPMIGLSESLAGAESDVTHEGEGHHEATEHDGGHGAEGHDHGGAVPGAVASGVSLLGAVALGMLAGAAVGGAHHVLEPALPGGPDARSYTLAGAGFLIVSGAPWLALPPVPAGAEEALPVDTRIAMYVGMMAAGALAVTCSLVAARRLSERGRAAAVVAAALPLCALPVVAWLLPANPVAGVPPELVAAYRGVVLTGQLLLWGLVAGVHARLLGRRGRSTRFDPSTDGVSAD